MSAEITQTEVVVVGGGQAGIAMSEHLSRAGVQHVVLERSRIAERWRSERWDSLVANGPCWHDRFPNMEFEGEDPDAFVPKERVAKYFEQYVEKFNLPVRTGVDVLSATRRQGANGFEVTTSDGVIHCDYLVAATGAFQLPHFPPLLGESTGITQLHSSGYKNPEQLPEGAVLMVGAGSSGVQIARELNSAGKRVYLAVGAHDRPPRRYRGRDNGWWLGVLGKWEAAAPRPGAEHVTISVSGANGGETIDFRKLAAEGITLTGRAVAYSDGVMRFAPNLAADIAAGDANYLSVLREADAYVAEHGLDLPEEPEAYIIGPDPECVKNPLTELNLDDAGVTTVLWATGFRSDYSWLQVDTFDDRGVPIQQRGVANAHGVYFLGLPWQFRRGSTFIWGVWHDAKYVADQICIQRSYNAYSGSARKVVPEKADA